LKEYYSNRAKEYEKIYFRDDPVRQKEQTEISDFIKVLFVDCNVLEIACGTGYWTERLAESAANIVSVDISNETLEIARSKEIPKSLVRFVQGDAYILEEIPGKFDGGCANFWFSHIPRMRVEEFLIGFHKKLGAGSKVFMADNMYVEGLGGTLITKEGEEDTYKLRQLSDRTSYEIIKNYYTKEELERIFEHNVDDLEIHIGECFWWIKYIVK
jgi:SAM-dependent methyltransferase